MTLPFYDERSITLDANGSGEFDFQPVTAYGVGASVTLTINGGISGNGFVSINNNQLGPIALAQAFGPFNVYPNGQVNVKITGGPTNGTLTGILAGASYLPGESVPSENLQFSAPTVQLSNVLVYQTNVDYHEAHVYGPFDCAQFAAVTLRTFGGPSVYTAGLDWFGAVDGNGQGIEECGSTEWTGGHDYSDISDTWGNLGPYVRLTVTPHNAGGCGDDSENWTVISLVPVATNDTLSLEHTFGVILNEETTVLDGNSISAKGVLTARRDAQWVVTTSEAKAWTADLSYIDSGGTPHVFARMSSSSLGMGMGVALPGLPIVAHFYNNSGDGSSQVITINLLSGRGTSSGGSSAGGGGGGGVTSFNTRAGAVTFALTDIPDTSGIATDVLTLNSSGVAVWAPVGSSGGVTSYNTRTGAVTSSLADIPGTGASDKDFLQFDSGTGEYAPEAFQLTDLPQSGATPGESMVWSGTAWVPGSPAALVIGKAIPDYLFGDIQMDFDALKGFQFTDTLSGNKYLFDLERSGYYDANRLANSFPGGLPALALNASGTASNYNSAYTFTPHSIAMCCIFCLNSLPTGSNSYTLLGGGLNSLQLRLSAGTVDLNLAAASIQYQGAWNPVINTPYLLTVVYSSFSGVPSYMRWNSINPITTGTYVSGTTWSWGAFAVGGSSASGNTEVMDGDIGKVLMFSDYIDPDTMTGLETELMSAWGF